MRLHKQEKNRSSFMSGVVAGLLVSVTGFLTWWSMPAWSASAAVPGGTLSHERKAPVQPKHVLVLGVDERTNDPGRSDTMMLVRFDAEQVRVLSIPRDTLVSIDGYGEGKANSAYTYGGPELAKKAVSDLLGVPVDSYVKVNVAGFRHLVDLMGGVHYDVPKAMQYYDPTPNDGLHIDLKPGYQLLDGEKAEQFVRFRSDGVGDDMGRIHRQQEFLKTAARQAFTPSNLPKLPQLLYTARQYVETDIPLTEQLKLAQAGYSAQQRNAVVQETVPGHGDYVDGISFFLVDQQQLGQLVSLWQSDRDTP